MSYHGIIILFVNNFIYLQIYTNFVFDIPKITKNQVIPEKHIANIAQIQFQAADYCDISFSGKTAD